MKTISKSLLTLFVVLISLISTETQAGGWGILGGVHRNSISGSNGQLSGTFGLGFHARPFEVDLLYSMKKPAENISETSDVREEKGKDKREKKSHRKREADEQKERHARRRQERS